MSWSSWFCIGRPYTAQTGAQRNSPDAFLFVGAFGKKLVRSSPFQLSDFFFGAELSLAALSAALVFAVDLAQAQQQGASLGNKALTNVEFIVVVLMIYLVLLGLQQEWDKPTIDRRTRFWRLVVMAEGSLRLSSCS